jgi:YQGE family putative transporter
MPSSLKRILVMNGASTVIFNYIGIFINLYLWENGQHIFDIAWFNLILFVSWGLAFLIGAQLLTKYSIRIIMRTAAIFAGVTFLVLSLVHFEPKLLYITLIAIPAGASNGFYATAANLGISLFGKGKEFADFFAASNLIGQVIAFTNPILFALIIQWFGFSGSFILMLFFVTAMMVVSYYLPPVSLASEKKPLLQDFQISKVFLTPNLKWMLPSLLAAGFFLQFQNVFSLIFTFSVTKDKLLIALLQVSYTACTLISLFFYKRYQARGILTDSFWLTLGMVAASIGFMIVLFPAVPILIISNILTTVGLFFFVTIWNSRQFVTISQYEPIMQARILVWRELLLVFSRIVMLALTLTIHDFHGFAFKAIMFFCLACALCIPYFSRKGAETQNEA